MLDCDICHGEFKTAQGLAGHRRLRHGTTQMPLEAETPLFGRQLGRRVSQRLGDKVAERVADIIMERHGEEIIAASLRELSERDPNLGFQRSLPLRAIIVAAGRNDRLLPLIAQKPVGLLNVGNRTIIGRELEILRDSGISRIAVVRGYQGSKINYPEITYYDNQDYEKTGMLRSLFSARSEMADGFVFCYSDIVYSKNVLRKLLDEPSDIALVVDTDWEDQHRQRSRHPISEAELIAVEGGLVTWISRNVTDVDHVHGEFVGLAKFTRRGAEILKSSYEQAASRYGRGQFHGALSLESAYFADMIQEIILQGYPVRHIDIQGGWAEIDTVEDLDRVNRDIESLLNTE